MALSFMVNRGILKGIESGGRDVVDVLGSWLLARSCIRNEGDFARMLKLIVPGLLLVGALLVIESITGSFRIIDLLPLKDSVGGSDNEYRLGLLRAFGPFSHAILAGLFMSSFITLYALIAKDRRVAWLGMLAGATGFFTLSSGAMANLALQGGFYLYRVVVRLAGYRTDWRPLALVTFSSLALLQLLTKGGAVNTIIRFLALDSFTGYFRLLIWEYGTASVAKRPWFGFGYEEYERPAWMYSASVDNHWLLLALRYGVPAFAFYFALALFVIYRLGSISMRLPDRLGNPFSAMMIVLTCLTALGLTVAFFNEFQIWYVFLLASGASMIDMADRRMEQARSLVRGGMLPERKC